MSEEKRERKGEISEAQEVREVLEAVQSTIPGLVSQLVQAIYSPEVAESIGSAVGGLYRKLKEQGIPEDLAIDMAKRYMKLLDLGSLLGKKGIGLQMEGKGSDMGEEIAKAIRRELEEKGIGED